MYKRYPIILGILLIILAIWPLFAPDTAINQFINQINYLDYDLRLKARVLTEKSKVKTPIAIIDIDDKSLAAEGRWPWPREKLALLVDKLKKHNAAVIAFDISFPEKQINPLKEVITQLSQKSLMPDSVQKFLEQHLIHFDNDFIFSKSLSKVPAILSLSFLPSSLTQNSLPEPIMTLTPQESQNLGIITASGYLSNIPILQSITKSGFINIFPDSDGILRRAPLIMNYQNKIYPSLALQAVLSYFNSQSITLYAPQYDKDQFLEGIKLEDRLIPTDSSGQVIIPFIGKSYTFPYHSATDILHEKIPEKELAGKILFVGASATGLGDLEPTAIENPFPGVEIQATIANGILINNFSSNPAWAYGATLSMIVVFGLLSAFIFPYFGPKLLGLIILSFLPLSFFCSNLLWKETGVIISILLPGLLVTGLALMNMLYGYLFETRRREKLKQMFGQYVPTKHIDEMLQSENDYALYGEDRNMSVLFADIRNFTSISEKMKAAELVTMLNTFFTPMTEIIFKNKGTIDKYVGDLIMAFWGAPLNDSQHAKHAIQSAIEMQRKLKLLQTENPNLANIHIGIGINSGEMSVGDMGSQYRRNYTVLGDSVNLASRVEGLSKFYGANIVVTESTQKDQPNFIFRKLDKVRVKGKNEGVEIFEVIGYKKELTKQLEDELNTYQTALDHYFNQEWKQSKEIIDKLIQDQPNITIYQIYQNRLKDYISNPPDENWNGVYVHTSK